MIVILMGVSGSGKSHIGQALSLRTGWRFLEGDQFHPQANIAKMSRGLPLDDDDRWPWLEAIRSTLARCARERESVILACSALKVSYRRFLEAGLPEPVRWVFLHADARLIEQRMRQREHFFPPALLESQLRTLETPLPDEAVTVDAGQAAEQIVDELVRKLGAGEQR